MAHPLKKKYNKKLYDIILKIEKTIIDNGIPMYINKWKKAPIPKDFNTYEDFIYFLRTFVYPYHFHTFVDSKIWNKKVSYSLPEKIIKKMPFINEKRKMPDFNFDEKSKIGTIIYYQFLIDDNHNQNIKDEKNLIKLVKDKIQEWDQLNIKGLIIDLTNHYGGTMYPGINSLSDILGKTTLFSFSNTPTKKSRG